MYGAAISSISFWLEFSVHRPDKVLFIALSKAITLLLLSREFVF